MAVTAHANERAKERYGITPTEEDWRDAVLAISSAVLHLPSAAYLISRNVDRTERWLVSLGGTAVIALYDPDYANIITLLPKDANASRGLPR